MKIFLECSGGASRREGYKLRIGSFGSSESYLFKFRLDTTGIDVIGNPGCHNCQIT